MSTEIAVNTVGALALAPDQTEWTPAQNAALEQMGIARAPMGDQLVFLHQAQRTGLDPFAKQIYMIGRWDRQEQQHKYTIQAGIDGLRVIAERTGRYEGRTPIQWCGEDGEWRNVWLDARRPPTAARCAVYKQGFREPLDAVAHFREFAQTKNGGEYTHMWATKGAHMLAKCCEALALRAAFPQDLSGIYTPEEMAAEDEAQPAGRGRPGETISEAAAEEYHRPSGEPMVAPDQLAEITRLVQELQMGKDAALELYREAAGREVPRTRLLTRDEAEVAIVALQKRARGEEEPAPGVTGQGYGAGTGEPVDAEVVEESSDGATGEESPRDVWQDLVEASDLDEEELTRRFENDHDGSHPSTASAETLAAWAQAVKL